MRITGIREIAKDSKKLHGYFNKKLQIQIDKKGKLHSYTCWGNDYFRNDDFITLGYIRKSMLEMEIKEWVQEKIKECLYSGKNINDYGQVIHIEKMKF